MQPDNHNLTCRVTALVSVGRHPESGRARRAEQDARAVEMGMALSCYGLEVLHACLLYTSDAADDLTTV